MKSARFSIWQHRWLFFSLCEREIKNRYIGSGGGLFWAFVHPLLLLAVYAMVFGSIFRVSFPELGQHLFIEFVAVGLWPWLAFQESVQRATQSIQANASLVRKVAFPHELLVYATVAATFAVHLSGFILVLLVLSIFGHGFSLIGLLGVFPLLGLLLVFTLGIALIFAALQVFLRDVDQFLGPAFMVLFYATPILYPLNLLPDWARSGIQANPMVQFITPLREMLIGDGPFVASGGALLAWAAVFPLFFMGLFVFRRLSPYFEDML